MSTVRFCVSASQKQKDQKRLTSAWVSLFLLEGYHFARNFARGGLFLPLNRSLSLLRSFHQIPLGGYVIPLEDRACSVSADSHAHGLRHTGADKISDRSMTLPLQTCRRTAPPPPIEPPWVFPPGCAPPSFSDVLICALFYEKKGPDCFTAPRSRAPDGRRRSRIGFPGFQACASLRGYRPVRLLDRPGQVSLREEVSGCGEAPP